jgi:hypothetical protein
LATEHLQINDFKVIEAPGDAFAFDRFTAGLGLRGGFEVLNAEVE